MGENNDNMTVLNQDEVLENQLGDWLEAIGVDKNMIPSCKKAIEFCNAGKWHDMVELPEGTGWTSLENSERLSTAPAREIARFCILHNWITRNYL